MNFEEAKKITQPQAIDLSTAMLLRADRIRGNVADLVAYIDGDMTARPPLDAFERLVHELDAIESSARYLAKRVRERWQPKDPSLGE